MPNLREIRKFGMGIIDTSFDELGRRGYNIAMLGKKLRSFRNAFEGIKIAWREEFNFRVQVVLMIAALILSWFFAISPTEWIIVLFLIGFVLSAEAFNTALEELCDKFKTDPDPHIAKIKDLAAAAVLIASATALIIGAIIFVPRFLSLSL
jgi:diacylglycerol kinase